MQNPKELYAVRDTTVEQKVVSYRKTLEVNTKFGPKGTQTGIIRKQFEVGVEQVDEAFRGRETVAADICCDLKNVELALRRSENLRHGRGLLLALAAKSGFDLLGVPRLGETFL